MSQSRILSGAEAVANVTLGFVLAVIVQVLAFPALGLDATLRQSLGLGAIFTGVSLVRGYVLRRMFETWSRRVD